MPALAIAEDRVGGFNLQDLPPGASSRSPANGSAYAARPTYTFDLASGEVLNQDARTLAATPSRPVRVPALLLYEEYHPYGTSAYRAVRSGIEVSAKRYRYAGKERDEETGLDHMGARYYAGWFGRWTAADPIGLDDGVNRYTYVRGNPVGMRDPSGTFGEPGFEHLTTLVTTGRGSGGKGPTLSVEPLLEDLGEIDLRGIDWVIVGGESGPRARPMKKEWVLSVRDQCAAADIPFFFKQWGGVRKKVAGRHLDGAIYDGIPFGVEQLEVPPRPERARRVSQAQGLLVGAR